MANHSCGRSRQTRPPAVSQSGTPAFSEPEVRRWPHPVNSAMPLCQPAAAQQTAAALHYIHCALSYQNQLLADIKSILEAMSVDSAQSPEEK